MSSPDLTYTNYLPVMLYDPIKGLDVGLLLQTQRYFCLIFIHTPTNVDFIYFWDTSWIPQGTWLLPFSNSVLINNLHLDQVGLPHVLDLAVHLVIIFGWMSQGDHSETLLLLALFYQSTPSCWKVNGGVGGWMVAHGILVSALGPHFDLDSEP